MELDNVIKNNLQRIHKRIQAACIKSCRDPATVRLLLATKTVPPDKIRIALNAGENLIGENKVQEFRDKAAGLAGLDHEAHFIGHLQTNKVKEVLKYVTCVQSVDRIALAQELDKRLQAAGRSLDILVQVNTSYEPGKFGIAPEDAVTFVRQVSRYDTLKIKGLMTIGLFDAAPEKVRPSFRLLKKIQKEIKAAAPEDLNMEALSMGMSGDLETAIEEGATIIRVGTAIFGQRIYTDHYYWNETNNTD